MKQNPFLPALSLANPLCHHCSSLTPCPLSHSLLCPPSRSPSWVSYVSHYVCDRFVMAFLAAIPLVPKHLSRGLIGFVFWALFSLLCALGLLFFVFFFFCIHVLSFPNAKSRATFSLSFTLSKRTWYSNYFTHH